MADKGMTVSLFLQNQKGQKHEQGFLTQAVEACRWNKRNSLQTSLTAFFLLCDRNKYFTLTRRQSLEKGDAPSTLKWIQSLSCSVGASYILLHVLPFQNPVQMKVQLRRIQVLSVCFVVQYCYWQPGWFVVSLQFHQEYRGFSCWVGCCWVLLTIACAVSRDGTPGTTHEGCFLNI